MRRRTSAPSQRMHLQLTAAQAEALNQLGRELDTSTKVATIRLAINVLTHVVREVSTGSKLIVRDQAGNEHEVILASLLPCLPPKKK